MQTITKTITVPKLAIKYDTDSESPREWSNLGYFITSERNYQSPDGNKRNAKHGNYQPAWLLQEIMESTADEANNTAEHMDLIGKRFDDQSDDEKVLAIYPVNRYEHSGVVYSLGEKHGFDYSNCGFYIITDKTAKESGIKAKDYEKVIKQELEVYNKYANGEVYGFTLYGDNGEVEDSCWGFYDIDDIKDHLPTEFKDEDLQDYFED